MRSQTSPLLRKRDCPPTAGGGSISTSFACLRAVRIYFRVMRIRVGTRKL